MATPTDIIKLVKEDEQTQNDLIIKLDAINALTTGEKAALTSRLMKDKVVYEKCIGIMGEAIKEADVEIEGLEYKNSLLENELSAVDKKKINDAYQTKKLTLQNDGKGNERVIRRLKGIMQKTKQITK